MIDPNIVNIDLVGTNRRPAALLDLLNSDKYIKENYPDIIITKNPLLGGYFISKTKIKKIETERDIGEILGMFFYDDPNFSNLLIDRIIGRIYYEYDACVYAEVGEYKPELLVDFEKSLISKCQKWGIEFTYEIEFFSSYLNLYNKWIEKDIVYITERKEEYKKLLYNDYSEYIDEYINNSKYKKKIYSLVKDEIELVLSEYQIDFI